jgi:uncharacterized membrane protein YsdA (DUF1294 family)/cold shock CspA family protein
MKPGLRRGQLIKWKDDRGFGFIRPVDGSEEIFLHISDLKDATRRPQVGDTIYYYDAREKDGKLRAGNAFISGARNKSISSSISNGVNKYPFPILEVLLLSIMPFVGSIHFAWKTANPIPLIAYPVMSLLTFILYADDKYRAKRGKWRTPETTLHLCELAGGWLGGFIAQRKLRHKTIKISYQFVFWAIVILHLIIWLTWFSLDKTLMKAFIDVWVKFRR